MCQNISCICLFQTATCLAFIVTCGVFRYIHTSSVNPAYHWGLDENKIQLNFNGSNTDGSFTTAVSNSFLSPLEKNPKLQIWDNLRYFSYSYWKWYIVCSQ